MRVRLFAVVCTAIILVALSVLISNFSSVSSRTSVLVSDITQAGVLHNKTLFSGNQDHEKKVAASPDTEQTGGITPLKHPQTGLEVYKGPIRHIFFHPLIMYPQRAFDGDSLSKGYNDWFVTVGEFGRILDSLYSNGYILIDLSSVYEIKETGEKKEAVRKDLLVPKGKKPLVISIDDMNYYEYMIQNGNASKLILDGNGNTAVLSSSSNGSMVTTGDDIVPMVDDFVRKHPDFSLNGAKGIIALTGYEGVLGYRTNEPAFPDNIEVRNEAMKMAKYLKSEGWSFASHGYGHLDANKASLARLSRDTERWIDEVESITGFTNIYIYPYGSALSVGDPKFKYLVGKGFQVFCGVGPDGTIDFGQGYIMLDRKSVDGLSLHLDSRYLRSLFDPGTVIDSSRPREY